MKETVDEKDKRSKLLSITKRGKEALAESRAAIDKVAQDMYKSMSDDNMLLCIQLLSPTQQVNAHKWHQLKGFEFET